MAAFATFPVPSTPKEVLALVPLDSPRNAKLSELQRPLQGAARFTRHGKAVVYAYRDKDADNLWLQPLDGSPEDNSPISSVNVSRIFHWSFDGSKPGLMRGHTDSDVLICDSEK